jgi:2-oxoglutarate ferredoxin oxidoreductase subunit beta
MGFDTKEYRSHLKPIWCPGCGAYGVLNAIQKAFVQLQIPPWNIAVVSGIGCSSRLPGYLNTYSFNAVHGRALPIASGVKIARPDISVMAVGGDGDGFAIGGNHFPHTARRNVDLTYVVLDNSIYGLTKGQLSPTSDLDAQTVTSPYGNIEDPVKPLMLAFAGQTSFIAQGFSGDIKHCTGLIVEGIKHPGFAFILVQAPCITYLGKEQFDILREQVRYLGDEHDPTNRERAFQVAEETESLPLGVIYKEFRPTFGERMKEVQQRAMPSEDGLQFQVEDLLDSFLPE